MTGTQSEYLGLLPVRTNNEPQPVGSPLQELVVEPDWSTNGVLKASYGNGWIRTSSPLSDVSGRGVIRFADGTSLSAPLVGAKTAYSQLPKRSGACPTAGQPPTCQWLTITAARLSTVRIGTSRGQANVPDWQYTVHGLRQPLVRVAVARSAMTSLPVVELPATNALMGLCLPRSSNRAGATP